MTSVYRYIRESVDLLAARAPALTAALWVLIELRTGLAERQHLVAMPGGQAPTATSFAGPHVPVGPTR